MTLQLGDTAPDFEAQSTEGPIRFHEWIGDSWAVLFSHPKDFTPVCTTELGYMARIKPEFDRRGVKIMGLSVDPVERHLAWADDIEETQGYAPNFPCIGDADYKVSKLYGMLPAGRIGRSARPHAGGQPDRAQRVRDRAGQEDQADPGLSDDHGAQLRRSAAGDRLAAVDRQAQCRHAGQLEATGEDVIISGSVSDDEAKEIFGEWRVAAAVHPDRAAATGARAGRVLKPSRR